MPFQIWLKTHIFANIFQLYIIVSLLILFLLSYPSITKQKTKAKQNKVNKDKQNIKLHIHVHNREESFWVFACYIHQFPLTSKAYLT